MYDVNAVKVSASEDKGVCFPGSHSVALKDSHSDPPEKLAVASSHSPSKFCK